MPSVRCFVAGLTLLLAHGTLAAGPAVSEGGRAIYLDGRLASGEPLQATVQKGVALSGAAAACVNCHRRSGLGGGEGQSSIRPIAGRLLFHPPPPGGTGRLREQPPRASDASRRPVYTRASLARALREGVDPDGRVLDPLMPRYALDDDAVDQLQAYLDGLSARPAPGVSDREIHFATVVGPGVDPDRRRALLDVLQAFFRDKNGGTRKEARRRDTDSMRMYRAYRTWVLHVWELRGAPETWHAQLDVHYRRQPVFAVVGGLGDASWQPVHAFCESAALPCVFPDVDYPVVAGTGYYSLYFSRGLVLEAEVLARQLAQSPAGRIVQVFRDDATGHVPAQALRHALRRRGIDAPDERPVSGAGAPPVEFWEGLVHGATPATLVVWLDPADMQGLGQLDGPPPGLANLYVSASRSALRRPQLPEPWLARLRMVYPFVLPTDRARRLARVEAWLRGRNMPLTDARTQANAFFAATLTGDAMAHLGESFSRDYFIERIEQMAETALAPSIYPRLSLGPGQRFASRGGYIVGFPQGADVPVALSDWLVP